MATAVVELRADNTSIPSYNRTEPGSQQLKPAQYPEISSDAPEDAEEIAEQWISSFNQVLRGKDYSAMKGVFFKESYWRDQLCLSWNFHTFSGPDKAISFIESKGRCRLKEISLDKSSDLRKPSVTPVDFDGKINCVSSFLTLETDVGRGRGMVRLLQDRSDGKWKAFTLLTTTHELKGHEEATGERRPHGVAHGGQPGRKNWLERRIAEENYEDGSDPVVMIVGEYWKPKDG